MKPNIEDVEYVEIDASECQDDLQNGPYYASHIITVNDIEEGVTKMRDALGNLTRLIPASGLRLDKQQTLIAMRLKLISLLDEVIYFIEHIGIVVLAEALYDNRHLTDEEYEQEWLAGHKTTEDGTIDDLPF